MVAKKKTTTKAAAKESLCGLGGCTNKVHSRKRCQSCLRGIWDRIDRGEFTEDEAVTMGLLSERERAGRKRSDHIQKVIAKLKK